MATVRFIYNVSYGDRYFIRGEVVNLSSIDIENLKPYVQVLSEIENTKETKNETKPKKEGKNERK